MPETRVMTLTEFLLARIGEDEALARADFAYDWVGWDRHRVLAECEAKRRIIESYVEEFDPNVVLVDHDVLRLLAQPYAGHPDFRAEWASPS